VIFTGLMLFTISKNLKLYSTIFPALSIGFIIIGLVMIISGSLLNLPLMFFMMDFLFCFIVAWYFYNLRARIN